MAAPRTRQVGEVEDPEPLASISLEMTEELMTKRGVQPDASGAYPVDALLETIRAQGWEPVVEGEPGGWRISLEELQDGKPVRHLVTEGKDLARALRVALWDSMTLATRDQARAMFDADARRLFGISGQEFLRRYDAGELDYDDPSVVHLGVVRSFGR